MRPCHDSRGPRGENTAFKPGGLNSHNPGKRGLSEPQHAEVPVLLPSNQGWSSKGDADAQTRKKSPGLETD